jgi:hypothetical protein
MRRHVPGFVVMLAISLAGAARADDLLRVDHFVRVKSTAPAIAGQDALIYVREVAMPNTLLRGGPATTRFPWT